MDLLAGLALLVFFCVAAYFAVRSPAFWVGLAKEVAKGLVPIIAKRMPPEQEAAWRDCIRRNGKWNHQKRRCE